MRACLRLLLCLPLLATTACAADAIAGPELVPEPEAVARLVSEPAAVQDPAPAAESPRRFVLCRLAATPPPTEPLYLIDGVPALSAQALGGLDPNEIDTIELLEGPAAAALYGSRAAKGVVIVTTRNAAARRRR